ncbi:MAG TPA: 50S ribosomal protein L21 [Patescibacteria group bacterium]|nr:50S ribosomal protein L21 [Patescibacteria group bacterium]
MKYAVIQSGGKQYRVSEGDIVAVEKLGTKANDSYVFDQVLLVVDGDKKEFGTPTVAGFVVKAIVVGDKKTAKVRVAKFKAKAKYRRVTGSRKVVTQVKIEKIEAGKAK